MRQVVARGERLAWRDARGHKLYSGELPLSTIHREYVGDDLLGCPAWAGDSLLIARHDGEIMELVRLTEDRALHTLVELPLALESLESDGERGWWFVRGHGLWSIDASHHGKVDTVEFFPFTMTADEGYLSWTTNRQSDSMIFLSDEIYGGVAWL